MILMRWTLAGLLGVFWLMSFIGPIGAIVTARIRRQPRNVSFVPLIGSAAGIVAILLAPVAELPQRQSYLPIALLPDWPILAMPIVLIWKRLSSPEKPSR